MDALGNSDHTMSTAEFWVYDPSYKKLLPLMEELLDLLCYSSYGDEMYGELEMVYFAVSYVHQKAKFMCEK